MSRRKLKLELGEVERSTLEAMRDHHPRPYLRERAVALLRIAGGEAAYQVACLGVLKPRAPDTVYDWLDRYERLGIGGLYQPARRRRKFSPSASGGGGGVAPSGSAG